MSEIESTSQFSQIFEGVGAKMVKVTMFSDFSKYWEILEVFSQLQYTVS